MVLNREIEEKLTEDIKEYFGKSYRFYHTLAAVHWIKELIKKEGGNGRILIPAIYLHDIGYSKTLKKNTFNSYEDVKNSHMDVGAKMAEIILKRLNFKPEEMKEIIHLISIHDKIELLSTFNEKIIFEADSLSVIDRERVKPDFSKEDYQKFLEVYEKNRIPLFKTRTGKEALKKLWPVAKNYFELLNL